MTDVSYRTEKLAECFAACDKNNSGYIEAEELATVARVFSPNAEDVEAEVKLILNRLDKDRDGKISPDEWNGFLGDLFQFMNQDAFDKHCKELLKTLSK